MEIEAQQGFEHHPQRRSDMTKFLTIMAVLTAVATPALAQSSANRVVKDRTQIEQTVPTNGQSNYNDSFNGLHDGGGF
jgi:hypothetical protein